MALQEHNLLTRFYMKGFEEEEEKKEKKEEKEVSSLQLTWREYPQALL